MVLACQSRTFFKDLLAKAGVHQLLLTTTNMAPEAYTLDAVLKKWLAGHSSLETHEAAAQAYCKYQDCRVSWGRRLFSYEP
jgi:hypothetical protein